MLYAARYIHSFVRSFAPRPFRNIRTANIANICEGLKGACMFDDGWKSVQSVFISVDDRSSIISRAFFGRV